MITKLIFKTENVLCFVFFFSLIGCNDPVKDGSKAALPFCSCTLMRSQKQVSVLKKLVGGFESYKFNNADMAQKLLDSLKNGIDTEYNNCASNAEEKYSKLKEKYIIDKEKNEKFDYAFNGQKGICKDEKQNEINDLTSQINNKIDNIPLADIDGNLYHTVKIGSQVWMKENLKVTKFRNGDIVPNISDPAKWSDLTTPAYCNYDNDASNGIIYGKLYNWFTIADSRELCPAGWHVPSDGEWSVLTDYLGGESVAGGKMKEAGTSHWYTPNDGADNNSGFTALPGGYRNYDGTFNYIGYNGYWWSATGNSATSAWSRDLYYHYPDAGRDDDDKRYGFSVRCLKD